MIIGIDLGTTNSLCAVFRDGQPQLIPNRHGRVLTPSVVGMLDSGELLVGDAARELRVTRPERCASRFKRWMGTRESAVLNKNRLHAEELSSFVLKSLRQDAEEALQCEITSAVITVPAYFNDLQRRATKLAGELAGLNVLRIINEPTAAALTYGFHDREAEKHILVVDLGGGTFDVTLMEVFEGTLEIIASAGEGTLGGEDFTDRLVAHVLERHQLHLESAEIQQPRLVARLRQECEQAKRDLGEVSSVDIRLPDREGNFASDSPRTTVTVDQFQKMTMGLLERMRRPISKVVRDAGFRFDQVDEVILVGGATRMPILRECIREIFQKEPLCRFDPDEVVALGAAVQAALIENNAAVEDMVMTDVCPFSLGINITKEFAGREMGGFFMPIIHRNTTLPVSREDTVYTLRANQREVRLKVYQGEHRKVDDNVYLGELIVQDVPLGPAGTEVVVRFTYDLNGLLEVEAFVPNSGKRFRTVLTNHAQHLEGAELAEAINRLAAIKFYPRDDVQHQRLLLYAERVLGELRAEERARFEQVIDSFEEALGAGNRDYFAEIRELLLNTLEELGFPYDDSPTTTDDDTSA
ncbi:MAG: Hsp70 family protein [Planctomycetaceae bacterium]|nr:Hsp70 family protein [Planctomycetaceae bacterium]